MYVAVQHTIDDPEVFRAKAGGIVPNLPGHVKLLRVSGPLPPCGRHRDCLSLKKGCRASKFATR
jgi:hypothetical protein